MDKTPNNHSEPNIELPKNIAPSLPMNPDGVRWPSCFSSIRISEDGMCREVMLNETAGSEAGKVWKFYPSSIASHLEKKLQQIKKLPFFSTRPDIVEDVDTLGNFVTQMWSIDDGFLNHSERRDFYDKNHEVSVYCSKISKLRKNYMGYLGSAVYIINRALGIQIDSPLNSLAHELRDYDNLDFSGKQAFVARVDGYISDYFDALEQAITRQ